MNAATKQASKAGVAISQTGREAKRTTRKAIRKQKKDIIKQFSKRRVRRARLIDSFIGLVALAFAIPQSRQFLRGKIQRNRMIDLSEPAARPSTAERISDGTGHSEEPVSPEHGAALGRS